MVFHVYDIRTNETLYYNENRADCERFIKKSNREKYLRTHWIFKGMSKKFRHSI